DRSHHREPSVDHHGVVHTGRAAFLPPGEEVQSGPRQPHSLLLPAEHCPRVPGEQALRTQGHCRPQRVGVLHGLCDAGRLRPVPIHGGQLLLQSKRPRFTELKAQLSTILDEERQQVEERLRMEMRRQVNVSWDSGGSEDAPPK
ncbi:hypothetical protein CRUP_009641, partial [Coryphaenoides rupestris]